MFVGRGEKEKEKFKKQNREEKECAVRALCGTRWNYVMSLTLQRFCLQR
jgi:hypothetical protein